VLITGVSNESIAGELAVQIAAADPKLLTLSARAESKVTPIINKIQKSKPNIATRFLNMELGDTGAIRKAVDKDLADILEIDYVVCVAAVMACPYAKTKDGFESQFGVNYLANFLLVKLRLPKVQAAGASSSIIIVASSAVRGGKLNFDDIGFSVTVVSPFILSTQLTA
jgi:NAD(P)-dependent dehydrogenase (short-subunit alcohol dehydrogenase family)